jgi:hypothetical protein
MVRSHGSIRTRPPSVHNTPARNPSGSNPTSPATERPDPWPVRSSVIQHQTALLCRVYSSIVKNCSCRWLATS